MQVQWAQACAGSTMLQRRLGGDVGAHALQPPVLWRIDLLELFGVGLGQQHKIRAADREGGSNQPAVTLDAEAAAAARPEIIVRVNRRGLDECHFLELQNSIFDSSIRFDYLEKATACTSRWLWHGNPHGRYARPIAHNRH